MNIVDADPGSTYIDISIRSENRPARIYPGLVSDKNTRACIYLIAE